MRKSALFFLLLTLILILFPLLPQKGFAGNLTSTFIRLSRQTPSTTTGGLVCVTTPNSNNGVENSVQISFPSVFVVNTNLSNWTVNTSDIPSDAVIWPGISNATSISGGTVTFPSSDLNTNTKYCFNFSPSNTLTTPSSTGSFEATIRTKNNSNITIDSIDLGLSVIANDGISVSATVPANATDFQATLALTNPSNGTFSQDTELIYSITYGSYLNTPTAITVEAEWDFGTIQGSLIPTEDILDYQIGTASKGYNNISPVIDVVNRKISWTISSIPGNTTNQTVSFRLKTNKAYKGTQPITFAVHGRVIGPGIQTADSTVTSGYYNSDYITPTPKPTCIPSECPTSIPSQLTPTPTVSVTAQKLIIYAVDIRSITSSEAAVFVASNKDVKVNISYGTSQDILVNKVSSEGYGKNQVITIGGLKPKTRYFFKVNVIDANKTMSGTDIYVFDTASVSKIPKILINSIIISSNDVLLTNYLDTDGQFPQVIMPLKTQYSFRFSMAPYEYIKSIRAVIRNNELLGIASDKPYIKPPSIQITEIKPGQFIGKLSSNLSVGVYLLHLQVNDFNGNLTEQEIAKLHIVNPLKIVNRVTQQGIENAKVKFEYYNFRLRKYEELSTYLTAIKNPNFSDPNGIINTVLPEGKYKAQVSVIGYEPKTVEFSIDPDSTNYPTIELTPLPFSITNYINYMISNFTDGLNILTNYISDLKSSARFLELLTFLTILLFIGLSAFQISRVFGVPVMLLPFFAIYHALALFNKPSHAYFIQGRVVGIVTNDPIESVLLHFANSNGKVFAHTRSNSNGEFTVAVKKAATVKITVSKKGFVTFSKTLSKIDLENKIVIALSKSEKPNAFGLGTIAWYFESLAESLFESFLILTIILEIVFAQQFGIIKALPCLIISIANVLLWALHARPKNS